MPDSVGKCPPGFSEEVLDRAVGAAVLEVRKDKPCFDPNPLVSRMLEAGFLEVFAAGFEEARKKVEDAAERYDSQRDRANWLDPFRKGKTAGFVAALAALTDTEGRDE